MYLLFCLLLLTVSGCKAVYPPVPPPQPINAPVDTQAAIDAVIAQPRTPVMPPPRKTGVVTRKALVDWLLQGKIPKLARPAKQLADVSDPNYSAAISMSPWSIMFFPQGVKGNARFQSNQPVTRGEFCVLAAVLAGQYSDLQAMPRDQWQQLAPTSGSETPAPPYEQVLDSMGGSPAIAWAYQQGLLKQAFGLTPEKLVEQGLHAGQAVTWPEIEPVLNRFRQKAKASN